MRKKKILKNEKKRVCITSATIFFLKLKKKTCFRLLKALLLPHVVAEL